MPPAAEDTFVIAGFCNEEEKPLGPAHANVAPGKFVALKFRMFPSHIGLLFPITGNVKAHSEHICLQVEPFQTLKQFVVVL